MDYLDNLHIDKSVKRTQDRLTKEGGNLADLLEHFRHLFAPILIGDQQWQQILTCARKLPVTLGALPFGFELPLHDSTPRADLGVSVAAGTLEAAVFKQRAKKEDADAADIAISRLIEEMDLENSTLRRAVGPKLMLEYDLKSVQLEGSAPPGIFLRPYARPIIAGGDHLQDLGITIDALVSAVGWEANHAEKRHVERVFLAQPTGSRTDSFGVFPSRERTIRLLIMGLESQDQLCKFLRDIKWPGDVSAVRSVVSRFQEHVDMVKIGAHLDVRENGVGPSLGLTPIVKERFSHNRRYFFDDLSDWAQFLQALEQVDFVHAGKLSALGRLVSKPTPLFAKSGRYVLLRGIHHIKLAISDNRLAKVKAYIFMVLSGDISA